MQNRFKSANKLLAIFLIVLFVITNYITNFPAPAWAKESQIVQTHINTSTLNNRCIDDKAFVKKSSSMPAKIGIENLAREDQLTTKEVSFTEFMDALMGIGEMFLLIGELIVNIVYIIKGIQSLFGNGEPNQPNVNNMDYILYNNNDLINEYPLIKCD